MSTEFIMRTLFDFLLVMLLIIGYVHEEQIIKFEQNVKRIVLGNYRRYKRLHRK